MDCCGYIQVLKRNGEKGSRYPVMERCVIGGGLNCDMRLYLKNIASQQCVLFKDNAGRGVIENLSDQFPTLLNGSALKEGERGVLSHCDVFTVMDRTFQWEYLQTSPFFGRTLSKNSSFSDGKMTGPLAAVHHSATSPRRVAVVTPVRRGDMIQDKNVKQRKSIPALKFYKHSLQDPQAILKKNSMSRRSCTPYLVAAVSALGKKSDETLPDAFEKTPSRTKGDQSSKKLRQSEKRFSVGISTRKSFAKENTFNKARKSVVDSTQVVANPMKKDRSLNTQSPKSTNLSPGGSPARFAKLSNISSKINVGKTQSPSKSGVIGKIPVEKRSPEKKAKSPISSLKAPSKFESPAKMTKTPSARGKTPSKPASPGKKTKTPVARGKTPRKSATPRKKTKTPVARGKTPSKSASALAETITPVARGRTPSKTASPGQKTKTPVARGKTPKSASPGKKTNTPLTHVKTSLKSASGGRKAKSPVVQGKSPLQSASSKKNVFVSRLKTPVKRMLDSPGSEQQLAKRFKLDNKSEVPSGSNTSKHVKKPLFSEVVKKSEGKKVLLARKVVKPTQIQAFRSKIKKSSIIPRIAKLANSTGHAESPETIIIRKKKSNQTPVKARKSVARNALGEFSVSELNKTLSPKRVSSIGQIKSSPAAVSSADKKMGRFSVTSTPVAKKSPVGQKTPKKATTPSTPVVKKSPVGQKTPKKATTPSTPVAKKSPVRQKTPKKATTPSTPVAKKSPVGQKTPKRATTPSTPLAKKSPVGQKTPKKATTPSTPVAKKSPVGQKTPKKATPPSTPVAKKSPAGQKTPKKATTAPHPTKTHSPRSSMENMKSPVQEKGRLSVKLTSSPATPVTGKLSKGQYTPKSEKISKSLSPKENISKNSRSSTRIGTPKSPSLSVNVESTDQKKRVSSKKKTPSPKTPSKTRADMENTPASDKSSPERKVVTSPATSPIKKATPRDIIAAKNKRSSEGKSKITVVSTRVIKKSPKGQKTPLGLKVTKLSPSACHNLVSPRTPRGQILAVSSVEKNVKTPNFTNLENSGVSSDQKKVSGIKASPISPISRKSTRGQNTPESTIARKSISPNKTFKSLHVMDMSNQQRTPAKRKSDATHESASSTAKRSKRSYIAGTPDIFNSSDSFDLSSIQTPQIPQEEFVSPLSLRKSSQKQRVSKSSFLGDRSITDLNDSNKPVTPVPETSRRSTPRKTLSSSFVHLVTPKKVPHLANIVEIPEVSVMFSKSPPSASRTSLQMSLKNLASPRTPLPAKSPVQQKSAKKSHTPSRVPVQTNASSGPRSSGKLTSPTEIPLTRSNSSPNIILSKRTSAPVKSRQGRSSSTPKVKSKEPEVFETPKESSGRDPQSRRSCISDSIKSSPSMSPVKKLNSPKLHASPKNDLRDVRGVKKLLATPKVQASPKNDLRDVRGVKKLLATPKVQASPKNDLRDVRGVKKLLSSPKLQASPKNDLTDVRGVKKLLSSPKLQASPKNDLRDVRGVKKLLATPKVQASPKNDLRDVRGVKKLLSSPKLQASPKNDLRDVRGVKKLLSSPKLQMSPKNDLSNLSGVKELFESPELKKSPEKSPKKEKTIVSASRTTRTRGRNVVDEVLPSPKRKVGYNVLHSPVETSTSVKRTRAGNKYSTSSKSNNSVDSVVLAEKVEVDVSEIKLSKTRSKNNTSHKTNVSVESIVIDESIEMGSPSIRTTRTRRKRNITESSDNNENIPVSPMKSRRGASKAVVSSSPNLLPSEVESPPKGKRTRTRLTSVDPSIPQKSRSSANVSPPKSENKNSLPPKARSVRGRTKTVEANVSPKASETNTPVAASPLATRRGKPKTVKETSKMELSKSSKDELPDVEITHPQCVASLPRGRRMRTKTQEFTDNVIDEISGQSPVTKKTRSRGALKSSPAKSSPNKSSPVKTRGRNTKKVVTSQNASEKNIDVSHSNINSALASPLKKQTRSKRGDTKTVTFTDNAPILLYESTSPIMPTKKEAKETSEQPVPTRTTRGRRATTVASFTADASEAVTTRTTRSRRK